jgi:hypothetical protein
MLSAFALLPAPLTGDFIVFHLRSTQPRKTFKPDTIIRSIKYSIALDIFPIGENKYIHEFYSTCVRWITVIREH